MSWIDRLLGRPKPGPAPFQQIEVRPVGPIASPQGRPEDIHAVMQTPESAKAVAYFRDYPKHSLMGEYAKTILYDFVRLMKPKLVAEIGTLHAGTSEVFARALWENGEGILHTADPYGGERCPQIIAQWPAELQQHCQFHAKSSMDFFARMLLESKKFGLILVDGNHDYEFALFDLQMAARVITPGGIVVVDNAEQMGPFKAVRHFLRDNPHWKEIGSAIASYDPRKPFERDRASIDHSSFLLLQAPDYLLIGEGPLSWGQDWIDRPRLSGLRWPVSAPCSGTLHYHVYLRGFADGNRWVAEERRGGSVRLEARGAGSPVEDRFDRVLEVTAPPEFTDALFTIEYDLSWQADPGTGPLALASLPEPLA